MNESEKGAGQSLGGARTLAAYGATIRSDYPFAFKLEDGEGRAELSFECTSRSPLKVDWDAFPTLYESGKRLRSGVSAAAVIRLENCYVLRFHDAVDFFVWRERIVCHLRDERYRPAVEIWFLGSVLAFWLEQGGIPALHAASVDVNGGCVGFLASNKGGKSSLAASFLQAGHSLLGDDILPLERTDGRIQGRPSYPQMRLWPQQAAYFSGTTDGLERVHPRLEKLRVPVGTGDFGSFCSRPRPLTGLYLPERRERGEIEIESIPLAEALSQLHKQSFMPKVIEATGLAPSRFRFFCSLLNDVSVKRLRYPSGNRHLPAVRAAIIEDLGEGAALDDLGEGAALLEDFGERTAQARS